MKKHIKKLQLNRETIRNIDAATLDVHGGNLGTYTCHQPCVVQQYTYANGCTYAAGCIG